jgi:hypothetical protein
LTTGGIPGFAYEIKSVKGDSKGAGDLVELEAGDQVRVTISGDDAEWLRKARETIKDSLEPGMVALATGRDESASDFSATEILVEFLVALSAEFTAEGLRATIAHALHKSQAKTKAVESAPVPASPSPGPASSGPEPGRTDVSVTVSRGEGQSPSLMRPRSSSSAR